MTILKLLLASHGRIIITLLRLILHTRHLNARQNTTNSNFTTQTILNDLKATSPTLYPIDPRRIAHNYKLIVNNFKLNFGIYKLSETPENPKEIWNVIHPS